MLSISKFLRVSVVSEVECVRLLALGVDDKEDAKTTEMIKSAVKGEE